MPRRTDIKHVLVIGSGPIVIGQACEFDYSGTQACRVLRDEGIRVSLINSNPATIMTDPEFADATYVEPINAEFVEKVLADQQARGLPGGRRAGHPRRADRAEHRDRAGRAGCAGEVRGRADRRGHPGDQPRRGPADLQGRGPVRRRGCAAVGRLPHDGRGACRGRRSRAACRRSAVLHHGRSRVRDGLHAGRSGADRRPRAGRVAGLVRPSRRTTARRSPPVTPPVTGTCTPRC